MKYFYLILFFPLFIFSQEQRPISTAFPFLLLSTDAIASGKGDIGVASSPDVFSQHWNASKYVFAEEMSAVAMAYTPYLNRVAQDMFLGNIVYYKRTQRSAWAGSLNYFNIGNVTLTQDFGSEAYVLGNFRPSEFTFDLSYSLQLSPYYAMGITARYLNSNLRLPINESNVARALAFDMSGFYTSKEHIIGNYFGKYRFGFQISNFGSKIQYEKLGKAFFLPTNLKLGAGYHLQTDSYNQFELLLEMNKLLVPSPAQYGFNDTNGNGIQDSSEPTEIVAGKSSDVDFLQGVFQSFSDAPDGLSEELREISWALGFEYTYNEALFLRTGYFNQHKNKGDRKYLTIGTGFRVKAWQVDFSYLFSTAKTHNPLSSSLRIALQYHF